MLLGLLVALGLFVGSGPRRFDRLFDDLFELFVIACMVFAFGSFFFFIYAYFALGWFRLRDRRQEFEELADDNTVGDPEAGERKLNEYLSAITSMEARIGMLQRSAPYIPPEKRPPPDMEPPRHKLTTRGRKLVGTVLCLGVLAGIALGMLNGIHTRDLPDATLGFQPVVLMRLAVCGALGLMCALPIAALVAAFNVEVQEPDDAGADRPEAA
jgi:hypothetical protein